MKEIEAKILEIDAEAIQSKLLAIGAIKAFETEFEAIYFDTPSTALRKADQTLRLRKEGDLSVLTFKGKAIGNGLIKIREEHETKVEDLEAMQRILTHLGYNTSLRMRKTRIQYDLQDPKAHIVIDNYLDDYAYIPTFLEIEAPNQETVVTIAEQLGYSESDLNPMSAADLIRHYQP